MAIKVYFQLLACDGDGLAACFAVKNDAQRVDALQFECEFLIPNGRCGQLGAFGLRHL